MNHREILERQKESVVENFIGESLKPFVETHLGIDFKKALEGELTPYLKYRIRESVYFETQKRGRTDLQMVTELIHSRCIELRLLIKWGGRLVLNGSDKDSLITKYATNAPDLWEVGTKNYYEVVSTYGGNFINTESVYLIKAKYQKLKNRIDVQNNHLILVDVLYKKYCILPIKEEMEIVTFAEEAPLGGGYYLSLKHVEWFDLDEEDCI